MDALKKIAADSMKAELPAFEIGDTQGEAVENILTESGYKNAGIRKDYEGRDRVVTAVKIQ